MFDPQHVESILKGIVALNTQLGVWSVVIPAILAAVVVSLLLYSYASPGPARSRLVLGSLVIVYGFAGLQVFLGSPAMGQQMALTGAVALWFVAMLLLLDAFFGWTVVRLSDSPFLRSVSITLMITGIVIYPIVEMLLGFTWPRMALFGAECPTTIFLIGLLIGCAPNVNRVLFILVSLNAMLTGFSVAMSGAPFDYLYGAAGVCGAVVMIVCFRELFLKGAWVRAPLRSQH